MGSTQRLIGVTLAVVTAFTFVDIGWLPFSTVSIDRGNFIEIAKIAAALVTIYCVGRAVAHRLRNDPSRIANSIKRVSGILINTVSALALFIPLGMATTTFMYMASANDRMLIDPYLAEMDAALGFDWLSFLAAVNASAIASKTLVFAYHSLGPQVPLLFLFFALSGRVERLVEYIALLAMSSVFTAIPMAVFPAAGAFAHFQPAEYGNLTANAGMWHYSELMRLRSGDTFSLLLTDIEGLVTFPSYHTALGILIIYCLRGLPWLFVPVLALNFLMIIGTLPEGGHYLIDVITGAAVGVLSIVAVRLVAGYDREQATGTLEAEPSTVMSSISYPPSV